MVARARPRGTRIAAIFPDGPARYAETVFNDDYCHRHGLLRQSPPGQPELIDDPRSCEVTRWTRCTSVIDPTLADRQTR